MSSLVRFAAWAVAISVTALPLGAQAGWQFERNGPHPIAKDSAPAPGGVTGTDRPVCFKATGFRCDAPEYAHRMERREGMVAESPSNGRPSCSKATGFLCDRADHPGREGSSYESRGR